MSGGDGDEGAAAIAASPPYPFVVGMIGFKIPLSGGSGAVRPKRCDLGPLSAARIPVLVIIGRNELLHDGPKMAAHFRQRLPQARIEVIDDAIHLIPLTNPRSYMSCLPTSCIDDPCVSLRVICALPLTDDYRALIGQAFVGWWCLIPGSGNPNPIRDSNDVDTPPAPAQLIPSARGSIELVSQFL
jgi:hypothetical protein